MNQLGKDIVHAILGPAEEAVLIRQLGIYSPKGLRCIDMQAVLSLFAFNDSTAMQIMI